MQIDGKTFRTQYGYHPDGSHAQITNPDNSTVVKHQTVPRILDSVTLTVGGAQKVLAKYPLTD